MAVSIYGFASGGHCIILDNITCVHLLLTTHSLSAYSGKNYRFDINIFHVNC